MTTDALSGSQVVAGEKGLDREVRGVIIGEIPDIQNWLRGNDFVATTAYIMSQQPISNLKEWVVGLFKNGAVALAIKTKRFINAIPQEIIDLGNQLDFPIIELAESAGQSEINRQVYGLIIDRQNELLRHNQNVLKSLIDLYLSGEGLNGITAKMSKLLENPVIIESAYGDLLSYSIGSYINVEELLAHYAEKRGKCIDLSMLMGCCKNNCLYKLEESDINPQWSQLVAPIINNEKVYGFVSVLEVNRTLSDWDLEVIEPMCVVIALELYKQRELYQEEEKVRIRFLQSVLEEDFDRAKRFAHELGFNLSTPLFCIVAHFGKASKRKEHKFADINSYNINISKHITHLVSKADNNACVICTEDELVVFGHFFTELDQDKNEQIAKQIAQRIVISVQAQNKQKVTIGIGRAHDELPGLRKSYFEALEAVNIIKNFCLTKEIANYGELGYYRILSSVAQDLPEA
ncbi:MAG TPA: PucR family transcriptional regulator ligand-binding domain-containing protein, partial [Fervidobacterium sp.]|nr:PucR family transcriptional regulator ligand-binding domain-containing protein [Fervidobacterium sp.]